MLGGQVTGPGGRLAVLLIWGELKLLKSGVGAEGWFGGAQGFDALAGVAAAEFGVGGYSQVPRPCRGLFPLLAVSHSLGEDLLSLLIVVAQGAVAGG